MYSFEEKKLFLKKSIKSNERFGMQSSVPVFLPPLHTQGKSKELNYYKSNPELP
jgi:hypothetical protein